ncbi:MAG: hypothetical protein Q8R98_27000, partial [Rubrivivax sp.]|nr:hypothetical protein [Rubrivivax sp.]
AHEAAAGVLDLPRAPLNADVDGVAPRLHHPGRVRPAGRRRPGLRRDFIKMGRALKEAHLALDAAAAALKKACEP